MRRALAGALLVAVVLGALPRMARADATASLASTPGCGVMQVIGAAGTVTYRLPHGFLRTGSDTVWTRTGAWRRGEDYLLDALRGDLRLLRPLAPGETLSVAACWLLSPPPLEFSLQRYRPLPANERLAPLAAPDSGGTAAIARPSTGREIGEAPSGSQLAVTGNKTIAVEFGSSQDAALRQSLDLAVTGTLAPGVELTGVLSDRNTPLTAQGSTQDLQSLDRVLLELRAPQGSASFGDIPLKLDRGEFARLERRVQGVRAEYHANGFTGAVAAASAQGEYRRMQFTGIDGLQGPYLLTDRDGGTAITVVAGSELVTVDGVRMQRGESADYSIDYERARVTFTNRRPIGSASRITVEYQYAVTRYRRNIASFTGAWERGRVRLYSNALTESDDRGRPLDLTFTPDDVARLSAAGDSVARTVGGGVTAGGGDYDSVRVAPDTLIYAFAGSNAGAFAVAFTRVGSGLGDYADSAIVAGRTIYHYVGTRQGAFVVGRGLPLPEAHRLVTLGGSVPIGPALLEAEGATSRRDLNTYSAQDDRDDAGTAARATLSLEGRAPLLPGRMGLAFSGRDVAKRFTPFSQLERPFAEEDWGLPVGADLEHQRRGDAQLWWRPREGREWRAEASALRTPDGYRGQRSRLEWTGAGALSTHALWLHSAGELREPGTPRVLEAGRTRLLGEVRYAGARLVPSLRLEDDLRRTPADTAVARDRAREFAADLQSGAQVHWKLGIGFTARDEEHSGMGAATNRDTRALRASSASPLGGALGIDASVQHRTVRETDGARTKSDLASVRLRADRKAWGLGSQYGVEVTSEAENRRERTLTFVGSGLGAYDAFGNFVGTGDYDLVLTVSPVLDRYTRVAASARASWAFGHSELWRGSRLEFTLEDEARRRGTLRPADALLSTGIALEDAALARASVLQRLEGELAPGSHLAALRLRAERRVAADRTFADFAQTTDARNGTLRWRARPARTTTLETEGRVNWQQAAQSLGAGARYERTLIEEGVQSQLIWQPGAQLRLAGAADFASSRPQGQTLATRTLKLGPDLSFAVGAKGRAELNLRRAFIGGAPPVALLPSADPAGAPRWDGHARFDLRLHETTTFGISGDLRERPGKPALVTGRAEVRSFF